MLIHLLRPFAYLLIKHDSKWKVDWLLPIIFTSVSMGIIYYLRRHGTVAVYSEIGIISKCLSFVQTLPGFYIAALAAIATFNRPDIDRTMPEPAPNMKIRVRGAYQSIELTRRRFLCVLFAFLTAESLLLIVLGIAGASTSEAIRQALPKNWHALVGSVYASLFGVLFWQMIIASFWGLYYLGERLHQPDPDPLP